MNLAGLDIETAGTKQEYALQPWRVLTGQAWITSIAWTDPAQGNKRCYKELPDAAWLSAFLIEQATMQRRLVTANGVFDIAWLLAYGLHDEVFALKWLDMILLWKRVNPHRFTYGLKEAVRIFFPQYAGYDDDIDFQDMSDYMRKKRLWYNGMDSGLTLALVVMFLNMLDKYERRGAYIEAAGMPDVAASWLMGLPLDVDYLHELERKVIDDGDNAMRILNTGLRKDGMREVEDLKEITNPNTLRTLLYDEWGCEVFKKTAKGAASTDKETLIKLAVEYPRANQLRDVRKAATRLSKFARAPIKSFEYNEDGNTHPTPTIAGTYTGRMTYKSKQGKGKTERPTGIALHQWERGALVRKSIIAPEGYIIGELDFSGQEMRLMADRCSVVANDDTMLNLFLSGINAHSYMGAQLAHEEYEWVEEHKEGEAKQTRYLGKFANLSLQYRVGLDTMRSRALTGYDLWLTANEADNIKKVYLAAYPGVPEYWKQAIWLARKSGMAVTMGHRHVGLDNLSEYSQQQTAINLPIQGTGADMKALAIAIASPVMRRMGIKYAWDLHDALFMFIPDDANALGNLLELRELLSNLPYAKAWGWQPRLDLPVDGTIGYRWGDMKGI